MSIERVDAIDLCQLADFAVVKRLGMLEFADRRTKVAQEKQTHEQFVRDDDDVPRGIVMAAVHLSEERVEKERHAIVDVGAALAAREPIEEMSESVAFGEHLGLRGQIGEIAEFLLANSRIFAFGENLLGRERLAQVRPRLFRPKVRTHVDVDRFVADECAKLFAGVECLLMALFGQFDLMVGDARIQS